MGNLFKLDSPVIRFMTLVTNLVCLNVLWLVCCLPIITAGASTAAMYYVIFQYLTKQDDAVLKPFFKGIRDNFKSVTPIWILNIFLGLALAAGVFYLSDDPRFWLKIVFALLVIVYLGASSFLYPLFARYDAPVRHIVLNSFALSMRHLMSTVLILGLNMIPVMLAAWKSELFLKTAIIWTLLGFSLISYVNGRVLLPIFQKYEETDTSNYSVQTDGEAV